MLLGSIMYSDFTYPESITNILLTVTIDGLWIDDQIYLIL
jgi:hypothetical protein